MKLIWWPTFVCVLTASAAFVPRSSARPKNPRAVLLSSIKTLTLHSTKQTTHRRVPAIPQLSCVGGTARGLYEVDVMQCRNQGSDYDDENIQWACSASLPVEFKLGSTEVLCEGYDGPDDLYVLKGSCGVQYRLMLTEKGEEKYGHRNEDSTSSTRTNVVWAIFLFVLVAILIDCCRNRNRRQSGGSGTDTPRAGGGDDNNNDPPPPYDWKSAPHPSSTTWNQPYNYNYGSTGNYVHPSGSGVGAAPQGQPWRPGFWSGALGGAAAGYLAGNRNHAQQGRSNTARGVRAPSNSNWRNVGSSSRSSSSASSSTRHESTGFGSTSRR